MCRLPIYVDCPATAGNELLRAGLFPQNDKTTAAPYRRGHSTKHFQSHQIARCLFCSWRALISAQNAKGNLLVFLDDFRIARFDVA